MENIYMKHKDEIQAIGAENGVDWITAVIMWQGQNTPLLEGLTADELEAQRREFIKAVDGVHE
jgi:hypothetical protein